MSANAHADAQEACFSLLSPTTIFKFPTTGTFYLASQEAMIATDSVSIGTFKFTPSVVAPLPTNQPSLTPLARKPLGKSRHKDFRTLLLTGSERHGVFLLVYAIDNDSPPRMRLYDRSLYEYDILDLKKGGPTVAACFNEKTQEVTLLSSRGWVDCYNLRSVSSDALSSFKMSRRKHFRLSPNFIETDSEERKFTSMTVPSLGTLAYVSTSRSIYVVSLINSDIMYKISPVPSTSEITSLKYVPNTSLLVALGKNEGNK